jgi:hypothetical protein
MLLVQFALLWAKWTHSVVHSSVAVVNFQVSILKVLASYPVGMASLTQLKRDLGILVTSGSDWARWTSTIAAHCGELDIFGSGLVERYTFGWRLTRKGLDALEAMENQARLGAGANQLPRENAADPSVTKAAVVEFAVGGTARGSESSFQAGPNAVERRLQLRVIQGGRSSEGSGFRPHLFAGISRYVSVHH